MTSTARSSIHFRTCRAVFYQAIALTFVGCAPIINIGGVYFPGWLLSAVLGVIGAYAIVLSLGRIPSMRTLADSGLLFVTLVAAISMASWLSLYSGF